jgi:simple sugar transport system ATP-binding protein
MSAEDATPMVEMRDIVKTFGTVNALRGVDFRVDRQEIVGLLGDNGAGKSTLIKILTGIHTPSSGQIYFEGKLVTINSPHEARAIGIETVYQDLALVPLMSISRNFWLGQEITRRIGPIEMLDKTEMAERTRQALMDIGIHIRNADEPVGSLSGGERQSIAIGRAVYFGKKLLILDEPTSALSVGESAKVLDYTRAAKERGMSVIFISHNIGHVHNVADRFTIISHGQKVGDFPRQEVTELEVANMVMTGEVPERLRLVHEDISGDD